MRSWRLWLLAIPFRRITIVAKNIQAISLDSMDDPLNLVLQNLEKDGQPGITPVYLMAEPNDQVVYMAFEPFTLEEAREVNPVVEL